MTDTSKWKFNHTMLRVKDPKESVKFFEFLGMTLIRTLKFPENKFDLYFLAYDGPHSESSKAHWTDREGVVELTHNYGTENDENYKIANGNKDPKGFGHICISVDNIQAACQRIEDAGYKFQKKLTDGRMQHIAFCLTPPDDYWVEVISQTKAEDTKEITTTDTAGYRMNHTMLRVKDPEKSLKFFQEVFGMKHMRTMEAKQAGFNLYFLGYPGKTGVTSDQSADGTNPLAGREGLLELTWNYGTEKEDGKVYHNGNDEPQGFGHICVSVDDLDAACKYLDAKNVTWKKRLTEGRMKNVAFVTTPDDSYWIEIIQNEELKKTSDW